MSSDLKHFNKKGSHLTIVLIIALGEISLRSEKNYKFGQTDYKYLN